MKWNRMSRRVPEKEERVISHVYKGKAKVGGMNIRGRDWEIRDSMKWPEGWRGHS